MYYCHCNLCRTTLDSVGFFFAKQWKMITTTTRWRLRIYDEDDDNGDDDDDSIEDYNYVTMVHVVCAWLTVVHGGGTCWQCMNNGGAR